MKSVAVAITLLILVAGAPLAAQDRNVDLTLWGSQADIEETNRLGDSFDMELDSGEGYGLSVNIFLTDRFSTEIAAFALSSDAALTFEGISPISLGSVDLVPVSVGLQFHPLRHWRFDPYVGAGAAYVMTDKMESRELEALGLGAIELDEEFTYYLNAGAGFHFTRGFALVLDGRYIPFEPKSRATVTGGEEDLDLTTLLLSAGLRFRF